MAINRSTVNSNFATLTPPWLLTTLDAQFAALNSAENDSSLGYANTGTDTGTANNYLIPVLDVGTFSGYNQGASFVLKPANTNTGPSTIAIGALGSVSITDQGGAPLTAGALVVGLAYGLVYMGTGFRTISPTSVNVFIPGQVIDYAGQTAPGGWLLCNGGAVSRTTFSALYAALGGASSPWGQGDGSTTFNVPDLRGRTSIGAGAGSGLTNRTLGGYLGEENHVLSVNELASHNHGVNDPQHVHGSTITDPGHAHTIPSALANIGYQPGATNLSACQHVVADSTSTNTANLTLNNAAAATNISIAPNGFGAGHNTIQPSAVLNKIIKF